MVGEEEAVDDGFLLPAEVGEVGTPRVGEGGSEVVGVEGVDETLAPRERFFVELGVLPVSIPVGISVGQTRTRPSRPFQYKNT